jgi:galactokinase/mevalonate kinase-like predicted kinase
MFSSAYLSPVLNLFSTPNVKLPPPYHIAEEQWWISWVNVHYCGGYLGQYVQYYERCQGANVQRSQVNVEYKKHSIQS